MNNAMELVKLILPLAEKLIEKISLLETSCAVIFLYLSLMFLPESFVDSIKNTEYGIGYIFLLAVGFVAVRFFIYAKREIKECISKRKNIKAVIGELSESEIILLISFLHMYKRGRKSLELHLSKDVHRLLDKNILKMTSSVALENELTYQCVINENCEKAVIKRLNKEKPKIEKQYGITFFDHLAASS